MGIHTQMEGSGGMLQSKFLASETTMGMNQILESSKSTRLQEEFQQQ